MNELLMCNQSGFNIQTQKNKANRISKVVCSYLH